MPAVRALAGWIVGLALLNFAAYIAVSFYLHGDAWNGYAAGGHFFLRDHATITEVTRGVYQFSWWYTLVLVVHWLIAVSIAGYWQLTDKRPFRRQ